MHWYPRYVPVDEQRARIISEMQELRTSGVRVQPIELRGRAIAQSFWGRHWCEHLESFSEYAARLAHGRAYVRNGSVCHLAIGAGSVDAMVVGSALYRVTIRIRQVQEPVWTAVRSACAGRVGSLAELLDGRLSNRVVEIVTNRDRGLFPHPGEIVPTCECSVRTAMCKHAAAVLSGVGSRLDESPELFFRLRGVDETELIATDVIATDVEAPPAGTPAGASTGSGPTRTPLAVDPGSRNGAAAPYVPGATSNPAGPAVPTPLPLDAPIPREPATRKVKRTFTYRPPTPAAALPLIATVDAGDPATGFQLTGELVVNLREQCGCSVAEFADLLQVTPTTVRRWETTPGPLNVHARPWEALRALHLEIEKHSG